MEEKGERWLGLTEMQYQQNLQKSLQENNYCYNIIENVFSVNEFNKSKQSFCEFCEALGHQLTNPIREDIIKYYETKCKKQKIIDANCKAQTILKMIQARIQKMVKTKRIKRNWASEDLKILVWIISKYCDWKGYHIEKEIGEEDWKFISALIPGVTSSDCMFKWLGLRKISLTIYNWSDYQSNLLGVIVNKRNAKGIKHNSEICDWKKISQQLYLQNQNSDKVYRNAKQCREHWACYVSPRLKKGPWQIQQDIKLLNIIHRNNGLKKWCQISRFFEGRTQNALKNRYNLILQKQKKKTKNKYKSQFQIINQYLQKCQIDQQSNKNQKQILDQDQVQKSKITCETFCPIEKDKNKLKIQHQLHNPFDFNKSIDSNPILGLDQKNEVIQQNFDQLFEDMQKMNSQNGLADQQPQDFQFDKMTVPKEIGSVTTPTSPIEVKVFKFKDFVKQGMQKFLGQIQPGLIDANGNFKKVDKILSLHEWKPVPLNR